MKKSHVINVKGEKVSDITLNKNIFGIEPNDAVLYDAITLAQASRRQGTADTKTRSEVSGGGRKPWRQKGTGRARQGSTRAPHWYHGGIVFGPHPRSYGKKMNRKERVLALKSALSYKVANDELIILDSLEVKTPKTKDMIKLLNDIKAPSKTLIVVDELTDNLILATRNIPKVELLEANEINVLDIIGADGLVITKKALEMIEEAYK